MVTSRFTFCILAAVLAIGCSQPGPTATRDNEGTKATVSQDGAKVTFEGPKGETTTVEAGDKDGGSVTVKTEKGEQKLTTGTEVSEEELGVPLYPGSKERSGSSVKTDTPEAISVMSARTTTDSVDQVVAFYEPKLQGANTMALNAGGSQHKILTGKLANGATIQVTATREKDATETVVQVLMTRPK